MKQRMRTHGKFGMLLSAIIDENGQVKEVELRVNAYMFYRNYDRGAWLELHSRSSSAIFPVNDCLLPFEAIKIEPNCHWGDDGHHILGFFYGWQRPPVPRCSRLALTTNTGPSMDVPHKLHWYREIRFSPIYSCYHAPHISTMASLRIRSSNSP